MRNHFHTHSNMPEGEHDDAGNNSFHEHWVDEDGKAYVYYPHIMRVLHEDSK